MSLIGFRRNSGDIEYLEEVEYSEEHLEEDLHKVIRDEPRLVMGALTTRENILLGSKLQLPTGKELDLCVCDKHSTITIIEFKRDRSPRSAITQLFDYASSLEQLNTAEFLDLVGHDSLEGVYERFNRDEDAELEINEFERTLSSGLDSPQLMLVAYSISDDVRRITRWLRDVHDLKINCVEFDYYSRDDAEMFIPTVLGIDETQAIKEREASPRQKKYRRFFGEILEQFKQELPGVTNQNASTDNWQVLPTGHSRTELIWDFKGDPGQKIFTVGMSFQYDDPSQNEALLETALETLKSSSIDASEDIQYGEYGNSGYTRFYIWSDVGRLDDALTDEELKSWAVDRMVDLHQQLVPVLHEQEK